MAKPTGALESPSINVPEIFPDVEVGDCCARKAIGNRQVLVRKSNMRNKLYFIVNSRAKAKELFV